LKLKYQKEYLSSIAIRKYGSEARFSHGICPDCMEKWYPGYTTEKDTEERE